MADWPEPAGFRERIKQAVAHGDLSVNDVRWVRYLAEAVAADERARFSPAVSAEGRVRGPDEDRHRGKGIAVMGWKLVRDKNEEWCRAHGVSGQWRTAPDPVAALGRKLWEELAEYGEHRDRGELYDLLDVLQAVIALEDPDGAAARVHAAKVAAMGGFEHLIEWSPVPAGFADWSPVPGQLPLPGVSQ